MSRRDDHDGTKGGPRPEGDDVLPPPLMRELTLLDSRENAQPGNPIQIRANTTSLRRMVQVKGSRDGTDAHAIGTQAIVLYFQFAERVFGRGQFLEFTRRDLGIADSTLSRYVLVARYATEEQAEMGIDVCVAGARIVRALAQDEHEKLRKKLGLTRKPATITDIAGLEFTLADESVVMFRKDHIDGAKAEMLVEELLGKARDVGRLPPVYRAKNERLAASLASRPALKKVKARYGMSAGKAVLKVSAPANTDLVQLAEALLEAANG